MVGLLMNLFVYLVMYGSVNNKHTAKKGVQ